MDLNLAVLVSSSHSSPNRKFILLLAWWKVVKRVPFFIHFVAFTFKGADLPY